MTTVSQQVSHYYKDMVDRNLGILTPEQQEQVSRMVVAIAGTGGNSDVAITLAQMGYQHFRLADPDVYSISNLNRQLGATSETLGSNKAHVVADIIRQINPQATVEVYPDGVTKDNVEEFLDGADVVIDGIDIYEMDARRAYFNTARENGQAVFTCPAVGFGAAIGVFDPDKSPTYDEYFGTPPDTSDPADPEFRKYIENYGMMFISMRPKGMDMLEARKRAMLGKAPAVAAGCRMNAAMVATVVHGYFFGEDYDLPIVPTTWHIDLLSGKISKTGHFKRAIMKRIMGLLQFRKEI